MFRVVTVVFSVKHVRELKDELDVIYLIAALVVTIVVAAAVVAASPTHHILKQ